MPRGKPRKEQGAAKAWLPTTDPQRKSTSEPMKPQAIPTINDDADYAEACRVQSELSAKHKAIREEIAKEEESLVADVIPNITPGELIGSALAIEPGVREDRKQKVARVSVLRKQLSQVEQALNAQADAIYYARRKAGHREFARDDGGYIKATEDLLKTVDAVIAKNGEAEQIYNALYVRGCDDVQHVLFPSPRAASDMVRWRAQLVDSIALLKQMVTTHAPR